MQLPTTEDKARSSAEQTGQSVYFHRTRLGLSVDELAQRAGVEPDWIRLVERSDPHFTIVELFLVADVFGVSVDKLTAGPTASV